MNDRLRLLILAPLLLLYACAAHRPRLSACHTGGYTVVDTTLPRDPDMEAMLRPYRERLDTLMNVVVGFSATPLSKAQPESTAGNFIADALLDCARRSDSSVVASVLNYGGIRLPYISAGPITRGKLYELIPFDNKLVLADIPGDVLQLFCDHIAAYGGWPVAGISFEIKNKQAIHILVGGKPLDNQRSYRLALPDYVADGGDRCSFLQPCKRTLVNRFIRDILIGYVVALHQQGQAIRSTLENRISYAE